MKKLLAAAAGLAASFGIANAVILDFEGFAGIGGLVNVNPGAPYFEDGFVVIPDNEESAVFDADAGVDMPGNEFSSFLGFSENNQITIVEENGGRFDFFGALAGPNTIASDVPVQMTVIGVTDFATNTFAAVAFNLFEATSLPLIFTNIEALIIFASDDAALDNIDVRAAAAVPVPGALPLFGAALAGFVAMRRRKSIA
ncbi:MAG: PEP-CTERM sorting domain-containing protein [Parvularculaceae bacterium]|nr:PEP-CTERM sorting domain-containing protein [Parvularculaceae bacterium]